VWDISRAGVYRILKGIQSHTILCRPGPIGACSDAELADHIRRRITGSSFHGEGYRKIWARLRVAGVRASPRRVRRVMREHGLLAPHRAGRARLQRLETIGRTRRVNADDFRVGVFHGDEDIGPALPDGRVGASIFQRGLTFGSTGNISVRLSDGGYLMTPTNASLSALDPAKLSRFDATGRFLDGDPATKESFLHFCMYGQRRDAGAVVHLHSTHSVAVSTLDTMVGASEAVFSRLKPVLETWAGRIVHIGDGGDGHRMKLLNNFLSLGYAALYSEALAPSQKVGISPATFDSVIRGGRMALSFNRRFGSIFGSR
jgi:hypothetical protein